MDTNVAYGGAAHPEPYDRGLNAAVITLANHMYRPGWKVHEKQPGESGQSYSLDANLIRFMAREPLRFAAIPAEQVSASLFADDEVFYAWRALTTAITADIEQRALALGNVVERVRAFIDSLHGLLVGTYGKETGGRYATILGAFAVSTLAGGLLGFPQAEVLHRKYTLDLMAVLDRQNMEWPEIGQTLVAVIMQAELVGEAMRIGEARGAAALREAINDAGVGVQVHDVASLDNLVREGHLTEKDAAEVRASLAGDPRQTAPTSGRVN